MKISVALCTYNGEKYFAEQIKSILSQTVQVNEIVIRDDGSTDNTIALIHELDSLHPGLIRLLKTTERLGVVRNFKETIKACEGDVIFLADQDDIWLPDKTQKMVAFLAQPSNRHINVVFSDLLLTDDKLTYLNQTMWGHLGFTKSRQNRWKRNALQELFYNGNVVTGAAVAFRSTFRNKFIEKLDFNYSIVHDEIIALIAAKDNSIMFMEDVTTCYRQHSSQEIGMGEKAISFPPLTRIKKIPGNREVMLAEIDKIIVNYKRRMKDYEKLGFTTKELSFFPRAIKHYEKRKDLPAARIKRIPAILSEYMSLRYRNYSRSIFITPVKDLLSR